MCGISGILNHHDNPDAESIVRAMNGALRHRGPDAEGCFRDADVALGHRRLAVIDVAGGNQPITNENGEVVVVLNGEIYNYRELRAVLEERGHKFKTETDAEVVVHLYEELGSGCVAMLDGMFAFAVYNSRTRRTLLARDRFGKKPLLYFMTGDTLVFASEFSALKQHPAMPRQLDPDAVSDYLSFLCVPGPNTIYRNVRRLAPAHQLELRFNDGTISIRSYWHLDYSLKQDLPFREAAVELRRLLEKAVEKRLMSDVPVGTFLSGGVDSTIITGLAAKLGGTPIPAFTIGFENPRYDERDAARFATAAIAKFSGKELIHREKVVDPCDFALLEELLRHFGEPFADASMLPTALLSKFAREEITVALSGDGADEVFSGYDRYVAMRCAYRADLLPRILRKPLCRLAAAALPDCGERSFSGRLRRLMLVFSSPTGRRYFNLLDRAGQSFKQKLFGERLAAATKRDSNEVFESVRWELSSSNRVERLSELDLRTYLPNDILPKVDICSMAASLEVRSPFLDRELVEFAAKLPESYKLSGGNRKYILKEACSDLLPQELSHRAKRGFGVPIADWLRGAWKSQAETVLFESPLCRDGYFREEAVRTLWREHQAGWRDRSYLLWGLLIFALFLGNENR